MSANKYCSPCFRLTTDGSRVREITTDGGINYNLLYNERNDQLLLRQGDRLCCINLDGSIIYRYDISGREGLAMDQQGHVYISGRDPISILLSFVLLVVLINCMEDSLGRVTTALFVHGTTVIPQG
jgi:hypothetical protein